MSFFTQFPVLQTERLILRQLRYDDGAQIHAYFTEELAKYYDWWPRTIADGRGFVRFFKTGYQNEQSIRWGITLKPEDKVIGTCGFSDFDHFSRAELGYELSMEHWHKGLMFEALQAIIPFGFGEMEMHRIQASVFPANTASIRLLEKFGFQKEGILREYTYIKHRDAWEDCLVMALLKKEFEVK
ncbi:MAG: GNAT family protein [Bacillota bacterium]|jgi:ribosomal-protein-alanine N-acetyltransferase|nr:GNAT family protein [Bacillota bacterium]HHT90751.1 GNAT family N-acetyltransferase [Bacillota bacterium]